MTDETLCGAFLWIGIRQNAWQEQAQYNQRIARMAYPWYGVQWPQQP